MAAEVDDLPTAGGAAPQLGVVPRDVGVGEHDVVHRGAADPDHLGAERGTATLRPRSTERGAPAAAIALPAEGSATVASTPAGGGGAIGGADGTATKGSSSTAGPSVALPSRMVAGRSTTWAPILVPSR